MRHDRIVPSSTQTGQVFVARVRTNRWFSFPMMASCYAKITAGQPPTYQHDAQASERCTRYKHDARASKQITHLLAQRACILSHLLAQRAGMLPHLPVRWANSRLKNPAMSSGAARAAPFGMGQSVQARRLAVDRSVFQRTAKMQKEKAARGTSRKLGEQNRFSVPVGPEKVDHGCNRVVHV